MALERRIASALLVGSAVVLLSAAPATAQFATKGALNCSLGVAKARSSLLGAKSRCVGSCITPARRTSGPYASCLPPFGGATLACIADPEDGAEAKARSAIVKSCNVDCPDCYQTGVCTAPQPIVDAGAQAVADNFAAVYCTEGGGGTPTKKEAKCENSVGAALVRLARARTVCFNKCNAAIFSGRLPEDRCDPPSGKDPKTVACLAKAEAAAAATIDRACGAPGAAPACYAGATGATWVATVRPLVDVPVPGKLDGTACDDGLDCTASDFCVRGRCVRSPVDLCTPSDSCSLSHCDRRTRACTPAMPVECPEITEPCFVSTCTQGTGICLTRCVIPGACGAGPGPCGMAVSCASNADCEDHDLCTQDVCDNGVCMNPVVTCDDGDVCTLDGCGVPEIGCESFKQNPVGFCNDNDPNTVDTCEPFVGCLHTPAS